MPIIKSAKKKLRKDIKRAQHNATIKDRLKGLIKRVRRTPSEEAMKNAASALDKAAKTKLIHPNKAARLKSRLAKAAKAAGTTQTVAPKKATAKKAETKKSPAKSPVKKPAKKTSR